MVRTGLVLGLLACVLAAAAFLLLTRDIYVVQSPSMKPTLQPGDAVVVKPLDGSVEAGQVIIYEMQGKLITHRVVRVDGDAIYTKGDAAEEEDPWGIERSAVRGEMDFRVPYGGYVILFLRQPLGLLSAVGLPLLLLIGIGSGKRGERRRQKPPRAEHVTDVPRSRGGIIVTVLGVVATAAALALAAQGSRAKTAVRKPAKCPVGPAKAGLVATALVVVAGCLAGALHAGGVLGFFAGTRDELLTITTAPSFSPIPATVDIDPDTLNPRSQGNFVTAYIELPDGYAVADIDVSTVTLELEDADGGSVSAELTPTEVADHDGDGVPDRMVKFSREAIVALLDGRTGDITFRVKGEVSGSLFEGTDTVRVLPQPHTSFHDPPSALPEESPDDTDTAAPTPPPQPAALAMQYQVQPGDTLWEISKRFGTTVDTLMQLNGLQNPHLILCGSTLNVPYVGEELGGATIEVFP